MNNEKQPDKPAQDKTAKLNAEFKNSWSKLSDSELALYGSDRSQFLGKLKENYNLSKEEAEKRIKAIEESCGCGSNTNKAA